MANPIGITHVRSSEPAMDGRVVGLALLGTLSAVVGLLFFAWPSGASAITDRLAIGLLFFVPGVLGLYEAKTRWKQE